MKISPQRVHENALLLSSFAGFPPISHLNLPPAKLDLALQHLIKECLPGECLWDCRRQRQRHKQRIKVGTSPPRVLTDTDVCVVLYASEADKCFWTRLRSLKVRLLCAPSLLMAVCWRTDLSSRKSLPGISQHFLSCGTRSLLQKSFQSSHKVLKYHRMLYRC